MKNNLLGKMEYYFGKDLKRIDHARRVLGYAEEIVKSEGGDEDVIIAAAIMHDIGIHAAEKKYGSTAGRFQEIEGPPIAKHLLAMANFPSEKIDEVLEIIAHHHTPGKIDTKNFNVLYDADWLVNLGDECDPSDYKKLEKIIDKVFLTKTGKQLARQVYLGHAYI